MFDLPGSKGAKVRLDRRPTCGMMCRHGPLIQRDVPDPKGRHRTNSTVRRSFVDTGERRAEDVTSSSSCGKVSSDSALAASRRSPPHPRRRLHRAEWRTRDRLDRNGVHLRLRVRDLRGQPRMQHYGPPRSTRSRWPQPAGDRHDVRGRTLTTGGLCHRHRHEPTPSHRAMQQRQPFAPAWPEPRRVLCLTLSANQQPLFSCSRA